MSSGLVIPGLSMEAAELAATARIMLAAMTRPEVDLSVEDLAIATGFTEEVVTQLLETEQLQRMISDEVRMAVAGAFLRGVRRMDEIVNSGADKTRDADKIAAYRAIVATHSSLKPVAPGDDRKTDVRDAIDELRTLIETRNQSR